MAYVKQTWTDRVTEHPIRRKLTQVSGDVYDISREQGEVQQEGTPITAERLNHMEDGIFGAAVPDGVYPDMSVGSADQIGAAHNVTVSDGFLYRPTAGSADVRDDTDENAEIKAIYGKTVVWNQLCENGNFASASGWVATARCNISAVNGELVITCTEEGNIIVQNNNLIFFPTHKYLLICQQRGENIGATFGATIAGGDGADFGRSQAVTNTYAYNGSITSNNRTQIYGSLYLSSSENALSVGDKIYVKNVMVVDLTKMFGAGNEPATVEVFRSMFPEPYYPYDAGSLLSFSATGLKTVGFNQWDEEWELGGVSVSGALITDTTKIRPKNYIPVIPLSTYRFTVLGANSGWVYIIGYEKLNDTASVWSASINLSEANHAFTPPSNTHYVKFSFEAGVYTPPYNHDICINLSHSGYRNGEYEPYRTETLPLPISTYFPTGMKSAGTVKDELRKDKVIKRIGKVVLDGTQPILGSNFTSGWVQYRTSVIGEGDGVDYGVVGGIVSDYYPHLLTGMVNRIAQYYENYPRIIIYDERFGSTITTDTQWNAWLAGHPVTVYYELGTPVETPINPPLEFTYRAEDFGTEEVLLPEGTSPTSTPMTADISYVQNLRDKLDHLPFSPGTPGYYAVYYDGVTQKYVPIDQLLQDIIGGA